MSPLWWEIPLWVTIVATLGTLGALLHNRITEGPFRYWW